MGFPKMLAEELVFLATGKRPDYRRGKTRQERQDEYQRKSLRQGIQANKDWAKMMKAARQDY